MSNPISQYSQQVEAINKYFTTLQYLSNDELRQKLYNIERSIHEHKDKVQALEEFLVSVFAIVKETARRFSLGNIIVTATDNDRQLAKMYDFVEISGNEAIYKNRWDVLGNPYVWNMVHYDEQLLGGIFLHHGYATEMATGEGKTLVATLPVFLNALTHDGVHLMTVNDYLSKRDFETTRPIYMFYGLTANCIEKFSRNDRRYKSAYLSDITFGTNFSFVFDYLYDHLANQPEECIQRKQNYAIIDELDSILIDDADDPHIVGGGNFHNNGEIFKENLPLVKELMSLKDKNFFGYDKLKKAAWFTTKGKEWLAARKNISDLYAVERTYEIASFEKLPQEQQKHVKDNLYLQNVLGQILRALTVFERDIDYIIDGEKIKIIDPHTGRIKESNRWEHGLHTAIEVKEDVDVQDDFNGMAVISLKNYFRLYRKIAGMSGTIMPVKEELKDIYHLQCASLPTHKPLIRKDEPLRIFKTAKAKDDAIIKTIVYNHQCGRPTLVGSINIKRSEEICSELDAVDIKYNKLNAKTIKDEAITIAKAGLGNTITVSTSVAGRGTDIKPSTDAIKAGGLMVVGTDLFDSVREDKQLKGRSGRQGNPGSSVFFASLEDQIVKNLDAEYKEKLYNISSKFPCDEISCEETRMFFEKAQANREKYFKDCRERTARKDDIVDPWRKRFYEQRNSVLFNADVAKNVVNDIIRQSGCSTEMIEEHLRALHSKSKEMVVRYVRNNVNITSVNIPFSDNRHLFTIQFESKLVISDFEYFCNEFKRQTILQIYDKEWKKFVLYMMENLDEKEIGMLDSKYTKMMNNIHAIILSRMQFSTIPFDARNNSTNQGNETKSHATARIFRHLMPIKPDEPCPCGSGKKYSECHGSNIRCINRMRHRR